jgi:mRNA-degrading endonuclease RelE of RelBE toxin-antitoxin system
MISKATRKFWKLYKDLPTNLRAQAKATYKQFQKDPYYPSLHFKQVHSTKPIYSARISLDYRVIGVLQDNKVVWFWIGPHDEYEKLIKTKS